VVIVNNHDTCLADLPPLVTCRKRKEEYISVEVWYVTQSLNRGHYDRSSGRKEVYLTLDRTFGFGFAENLGVKGADPKLTL
jgi:predicted membrane-bound dolichyl-phosphate-mannose-protein mannosyltransferase